jgi:hypothetical protein
MHPLIRLDAKASRCNGRVEICFNIYASLNEN